MGRDLDGRAEFGHRALRPCSSPQRKAVPLLAMVMTAPSHGVAHHNSLAPLVGRVTGGEAIIGFDGGLSARVFHRGRDVGELLDVLAVADQVFPASRTAGVSRAGTAPVKVMVCFTLSVPSLAKLPSATKDAALPSALRSGQRAGKQTRGQETERIIAPIQARRRLAGWRAHEVKPPISRSWSGPRCVPKP